MDHPLVSIGIPVYNEQRFLEKGLISLLAQDYPNVEILITDNGSTDASQSIIEKYRQKHPNIHVHRFAENKGAVASFNDCCRRAQGKYFMWAGAHDLWEPSYISRCVEVLEADESVVGVQSLADLIDIDDSTLGMYDDEIQTRGMPMFKRYAHVLWFLASCNLIHGVWRRKELHETALFQGTWAPDNLIIAHMSLKGSIAVVPQNLFHRRQVRPEETREAKDARIVKSLDPSKAKSPALPRLLRGMRNAHLRMIARTDFGLLTKIRLWLMTLRIFAIRHYVFPFGFTIKRLVGYFPADLRDKLYLLLARSKRYKA
jgi:glycosyltransferase involved in cell wall biosynthesis